MALEDRRLPTAPSPALSSEAVTLLFRPLVISGMMACIGAAWVAVAQLFSPYWRGAYLVLATALLTLETLLSEQLAERLVLPAHRVRVRVAELALAALLLRPMMYLQLGWSALRMDATTWLRDPIEFLNNLEYLAGLLVLLGLWSVALDISRALKELADPYTRSEGREMELSHLSSRFIGGALFLLAAAGVMQVQLSPRGILLRPVERGTLTWLPLVYLGLGLLLFGQARYALFRAKWQREAIPVAPELGQRWVKWGSVFVASVCLLAMLLPAGTTELGFLLFVWLSFLATAVGGLLLFALQFLLYILLLPVLSLFKSEQAPIRPQPQLPPIPELPTQVTTAFPSWWEYLRLTVFWVAASAVLLWLIRELVRHWQAIGVWPTLRQGILGWLASLWRTLLERWFGVRQKVRTLRPGKERGGKEPAPAPATRWARWQVHTMRERVRRLYLLMLERARQAGAARAPHETPCEYAERLAPRVSGEENALRGLTQAFVEARYSQRDFELQDMRLLQRLFNRLRRRLRQL
jgi:hypothetical protein